MKEYTSKIKESWRKDATIIVSTLLRTTEDPRGTFTNKEELVSVGVRRPTYTSYSSFQATKNGKQKLMDFISKEISF